MSEQEQKYPSLSHFAEAMTPFDNAVRNAHVFVSQMQLSFVLQDSIERWCECTKYMTESFTVKEEQGAVIEAMKEARSISQSVVNISNMYEFELGISA